MRKPRGGRSKAVREPMQVYLAPDESALLGRLATEAGLSKAEVLRRGIRSYAAEQGGASPMLRFLSDSAEGWPRALAARHDDVLAESYRAPGRKRR